VVCPSTTKKRATTEELADARASARSHFFGYDEPGEVKYMPGTEEVNSRERRFLGWFAFSFRLSDGKHPSELAAATMLSGDDLAATLKSLQSSRYVMAIVAMVNQVQRHGSFLQTDCYCRKPGCRQRGASITP